MKIEFSRSGGFAAPAMRQQLEIDTNDLPPHEASELLELISKADIRRAVPVPPAPATPDAFYYRIKISDGDISHTATASDAHMPESLSPLVEWLADRASQKK